MLLLTVQALGELAVLYPVNGAFFTYCVRFINPSWLVLRRTERKRERKKKKKAGANSITNRGFAVGWDYAISWLVILPFELTAAGITIRFWREDLNVGIWIAVFLVVLSAIQIFGVRGYGEGRRSPSSPGGPLLTKS